DASTSLELINRDGLAHTGRVCVVQPVCPSTLCSHVIDQFVKGSGNPYFALSNRCVALVEDCTCEYVDITFSAHDVLPGGLFDVCPWASVVRRDLGHHVGQAEALSHAIF